MDQIWIDLLSKQAPIILVLCLGSYGMYKYFTAQIAKASDANDAKDAIIQDQNAKVMALYGKAIEASTKATEVQEQLIDLIKETKADVKILSNQLSFRENF